MGVSAEILAYARDLFAGMGAVSSRRMFGAAGLWAEGAMFVLIDVDRIYLKTDPALEAALRAEGAQAWIYTERNGPKAGLPQQTSYLSLPEAACDDPDEACAWGRRALAVALAAKAAKPARRGKRGARRISPEPYPGSR